MTAGEPGSADGPGAPSVPAGSWAEVHRGPSQPPVARDRPLRRLRRAAAVALVLCLLDLTYSKAQVLQMCADVAYFGHGFYGLAAASCGYFGQRPAQLSWAQAAMLAGLVLRPSADNPLDHPARARAREAHVLGRLVATQVLTSAQAAAAQPLSRLVAQAGTGCGSS